MKTHARLDRYLAMMCLNAVQRNWHMGDTIAGNCGDIQGFRLSAYGNIQGGNSLYQIPGR